MSWLVLKIDEIKDDDKRNYFLEESISVVLLKTEQCPFCYVGVGRLNTDVVCEGCQKDGILQKEILDYLEDESKTVG